MPADPAHEVEKINGLRLMMRGAVMDTEQGAETLKAVDGAESRIKAFMLLELKALETVISDREQLEVATAVLCFDLLAHLSETAAKAGS